MRITGIVIAGGKSSRMGKNKALVEFKGQRMIDKAIAIIQPFCDEILISTNETIPNIPYPQIGDEYKSIGPIGGLHSCLNKSKTAWDIVIPCDTPMIDAKLYGKLLANSDNYDAVIARHSDGKVEPLLAMYSRSILPIIENQISEGDYKIMNLLAKLNVNYLEFSDASMFKNVNTPNDIRDV